MTCLQYKIIQKIFIYQSKPHILLCIYACNTLEPLHLLLTCRVSIVSYYCIPLKQPHGKILLEGKEMVMLITNTAILMTNTLNMLISVHLQYPKHMSQSHMPKSSRMFLHEWDWIDGVLNPCKAAAYADVDSQVFKCIKHALHSCVGSVQWNPMWDSFNLLHIFQILYSDTYFNHWTTT